jgi:hypothetical protein
MSMYEEKSRAEDERSWQFANYRQSTLEDMLRQQKISKCQPPNRTLRSLSLHLSQHVAPILLLDLQVSSDEISNSEFQKNQHVRTKMHVLKDQLSQT